MMEVKTLYQTLKDKNNDYYIRRHGPFPCNWSNTWLGDGFYFWDTFIENAKWWGEYGRGFKKFVITTGICDFTTEKCFDLAGHTPHMVIFKEAVNMLIEANVADKNTTVPKIIEYLKLTGALTNYEAIRVNGIKSKRENNLFTTNLRFENDKLQYMEIDPAIQLCLFSKKSLNFREYKIIEKIKIENT